MLTHATNFTGANEPSNQSLSAAINRCVRSRGEPQGVRNESTPIAEGDGKRAQVIWLVASALLGVSTLTTAWFHRRSSPIALEASLSYLFLHLVSRKTWETHLVSLILVYGALIAAALSDRGGRARLWACIAGAAFLQNFYSPLFVGKTWSNLIQAYSPTTWSLLLLWGATVYTLLSAPAESVSDPTQK
jgi:hypothetical protein